MIYVVQLATDSSQEMEVVSREDILQPSLGFRVPSIEPIKVIPPHATLEIKSKLMQYVVQLATDSSQEMEVVRLALSCSAGR